jgi:hypothetical protein
VATPVPNQHRNAAKNQQRNQRSGQYYLKKTQVTSVQFSNEQSISLAKGAVNAKQPGKALGEPVETDLGLCP